MTAVAIARYLPEFEAAGEPRSGAFGAWGLAAASVASKTGGVDEAFARGLERGKAAAEAELAGKLAERDAQHAKALAAARQAWVLDEGGKLAAQLAKGLEEIQARIATAAARLLRPLVAEELRNRAISGLVESLHVLLQQDTAAAVEIFGAPDLLEVLRARLDGNGASVSYHPSQTTDVRVTMGQTVLETRLGDWMARVEEALK